MQKITSSTPNMNKYSVLAVFLSILTGLLLGSYLANKANEEEKAYLYRERTELRDIVKEDLEIIDSLVSRVIVLDKLVRTDSATIKTLTRKIGRQDSVIQKQRNEAANYTPSERRDWIIKRYTN